MNRLLTKLNIIKSNTLVKKGQLLYNHNNEGVLDNEGRSLPEGLYLVKSSQLVHKSCNDNKKKYYHNLELVGIDCNGLDKLSLSKNNYSISLDSDSIQANFRVGKQTKKGVVYEYIKSVFDKAGKEGFDPKIDYDSVINKVAWKIMNRSPIKVSEDEAEDIILDVLMNTVTDKMVKNFDPSRDFNTYLISYFYKRMLSYMSTWISRKTREVKDQEQDQTKDTNRLTEEERLDYRDVHKNPHEDISPEGRVSYKELLKGITQYMGKKPHGSELVKVFNDMIKGYSSTEIAKRNGVSPSLISRYTNSIRDYLKNYAEQTGNQDLLVLMSKHSKKRMHSDKDVSIITRIFDDYKKKFGEADVGRKPVGEVKKVKRTYLKDKVSDDAIKNAILSDTYSAKDLKAELGQYFSLLNEQDELIDSGDGKLVGLKVISDDVRNVEDTAKCKKKKKSNDVGYFVYSRSGMGPHKVLKTDGTFSIKLNRNTPVKIFKSKVQAEKAASRYQHTKLSLHVGLYPDEFLKEVE